MSPGIRKSNENKKIDVICPDACETAKCIHGLFITKCNFCVNRFSLKHPAIIRNPVSQHDCQFICKNYDCPGQDSCKSSLKQTRENLNNCPTDCPEAVCLKRTMRDPKGDIPSELLPCICDSTELEEFAEGPVNTCGYGTCAHLKNHASDNENVISKAVSKIFGRDSFEVILREPLCKKNTGWLKTFTKSKHLDGSFYEGTINDLGFGGKGHFCLPHGVTYDGDFNDGTYHGEGTLTYPTGVIVQGTWEKGKNIAIKSIRFADGLKYKEHDWEYLSTSDRRFYPEHTEGLQADCSLYRSGKSPTPVLPTGTYDTGDGYYSPKQKWINDFETNESIRIPGLNEVNWIQNNCRFGWRETIGNKIIR